MSGWGADAEVRSFSGAQESLGPQETDAETATEVAIL